MSTRVTSRSGATPRQRTRRGIGNSNRRATIHDVSLRMTRPQPPRTLIEDERRTVELMHKPNGDPNHYNASPRVLKQKREVSDTAKQADTAAGAAKPPMQASEPVEAGPISSLRAQMSPDDSARFFWGKVQRTLLS